jgi:hypothetical protein
MVAALGPSSFFAFETVVVATFVCFPRPA